jgi:hypothetical protein
LYFERPKVVFNERPEVCDVVSFRIKDQGYLAARVGVAVADKPVGPYTYLVSYRPNPGVWPMNMSDEQKADTTQLSDFKSGGLPNG